MTKSEQQLDDRSLAEQWGMEAKRLRRMVENLPAGAVYVDHESVELNRAAEEITGYCREEIQTLDDWYGKLFGEREAEIRKLHREDHRAGFPKKATIVIRRKDGSERRVEFAGHAFDDHEVWLMHDVTEQAEAAQLMRIQERAIQAAQNGILITDATRKNNPVIFCNDAMETMTGFTREEFLGRSCRFLQAGDRDQAAIAEVRNAIARGIPCHVVLRNYRKDGTLFWNELSLSPIRNDDGKLIHFVSIQKDLTDRKAMEAELANETAMLASVLRSVPDALMIEDLNRNITFCNPGVEKVFGYEPQELIGQPKSVLYADSDEFERQGKQRFHSDAEQDFAPLEVAFRRKDGREFIGELAGTIFRDADQEPIGFLGLIRDVSDRNRLQAAQRRYHEVLEAFSEGSSLDDLLKLIVRQAEEARPGMLASILLLDSREECLRGKYGSSIPPSYQDAIDGLKIGPKVGSCGTAAFTGKRVIVEDIETHSYWEGYRELAAESGLRACWSEPILSPSNDVLGTLAMYFREPRSPTESDLQLLEHSAKIAAIAIDRSRSNERNRKSEERYRSLVIASSATVWVTSPQGQFDFPQAAWEEYTGQPWTEHQGEGWLKMIHHDDRARVGSVWMESVQSGAHYKTHGRIWNAATEEYRHFEVQAVSIRDDGGQIIEWVGSTIDVHNRVTAQLQLQKREHEFRVLADNVPEFFAYIDAQHRYLFVNRKHEDIMGRPRADLVGKHVKDLVGETVYETYFREKFKQAFAGQRVSFECEINIGGLGNRWVNIVAIPDIRAQNVLGIFALASDITERRMLQKQVLDIAAEENRRIAQDLHDGIGQELTGIGMIADALVTSLSRQSAPEVKIATRLQADVRRTLAQVRALARGMNPVDIDGRGLMVAISAMCDRMQELDGIECEFECQQSVSLHDNQVATQLYRIAQEATTNAIKHGKASRIQICLIVDVAVPRLEITDNGVGIGSAKAKTAGMGMRTMRYRADVIGGQLTLENSDGGGTKVACTFPAEAICDAQPDSEKTE